LVQVARVLQQQAHLLLATMVAILYLMLHLLVHLRGALLLLAVVAVARHQVLRQHQVAVLVVGVLAATPGHTVVKVALKFLVKETKVVMALPLLHMVLAVVAERELLE
jgi:hypothetical protein